MRATWAYNVFHYMHLMHAAERLGIQGQAFLPWAPAETLARPFTGRALAKTPLARVGRRARRELPSGIRYRTFSAAQFLPPLAGALGRSLSTEWTLSYLVRQARRIARQTNGFDLYHAAEGLLLEPARQRAASTCIVERRALHDADFIDIEPINDLPAIRRNGGGRWVERTDEEMALADAILVYSSVARDSFVRRGADAAKVHIIPLGTACAPPGEAALARGDRHQLLFIGQASAVKGLDVAIEVTKLLGAPFILRVAGYASPPVRDWLARQQRVIYEGLVPRARLDELARSSGILIAPSTESFGLAALDAAVNGAYVVGSSKMGLSDWLPDIAGEFIASKDPAIWADRISALTADPSIIDSKRRDAASCAAGNLSWEDSGRALASHYQSIMGL